MSDKTCKDAYQEERIYRRSERLSWKNHGLTLDDWEGSIS